jgi:hypothetical protein
MTLLEVWNVHRTLDLRDELERMAAEKAQSD